MKKFLFFLMVLFSAHCGFSQAYVPMPADSAFWRYRIYDADYLVQVTDFILFLNGKDTVANGHTYHQVYTRQCTQIGGTGFNPPVVAIEASAADLYYGAIRDSGRQVFLLAGAGEQLIFDFTVSIGDSIPAYDTKDKVTGIDSVLLSDGVFHKRYLTTDPTYFTIEGVGSNRGLFPDLNDGGSDITFFCLTHSPLIYSPDTTLPCTYVYPAGYWASASNINNQSPDVKIFPVPACDMLHISSTTNEPLSGVAMNDMGQVVWHGTITNQTDIPVITWPRGVYYLRLKGSYTGSIIRKIIIE